MSPSIAFRLGEVPAVADPARTGAVSVARPSLPPADAILPYLGRIDGARWYTNFGPLITEFEARLSARLGEGTQVCTVANATQAITLALKAMDIPAGRLCAMPSWTFVATAHAAVQAGLVPWFVDVADDAMLDPLALEAKLGEAPGKVGAVIPVAAFGAPLDQAAWKAFQERSGVWVLIDAAAAFDTLSDIQLPSCVSLHATKALGVGEGGFLATDDGVLFDRFRRLTSFGFRGSRESTMPATNAKLSEYAAAVGLAGLDQWPSDRLRYLRAAQSLRMGLTARTNVRFQAGWGLSWVSTVCVVELPDGAAEHTEGVLAEFGIETRRWWGMGCHLSPAFASCPRTSLPQTERLAASTLGIPFAIDLEAETIARIDAALAVALG